MPRKEQTPKKKTPKKKTKEKSPKKSEDPKMDEAELNWLAAIAEQNLGWPGALDPARGDARRVSLRVLRFQNDDRRFGLWGRAPREVSGDHPHWAKVNIVGWLTLGSGFKPCEFLFLSSPRCAGFIVSSFARYKLVRGGHSRGGQA